MWRRIAIRKDLLANLIGVGLISEKKKERKMSSIAGKAIRIERFCAQLDCDCDLN
jgi:hypothetical protein